MGHSGNFETIVAGLSQAERQRLLDKLREQAKLPAEPRRAEKKAGQTMPDVTRRFENESAFAKFLYFLLSIFRSKAPAELFAEKQMAKLGKAIEKRYPGLYDHKKQRLLGGFCQQLARLRDASRFFLGVLDERFNQDKGAFYRFLGSLEMPEVDTQLEGALAAAAAREKAPSEDSKQEAYRLMQDALSQVKEAHKAAMYTDIRCFLCLRKLASFPFDRAIASFTPDMQTKTLYCAAPLLSAQLRGLADILYSLREPTPLPLLESLFLLLIRAGDSGGADEAASAIADVDLETQLQAMLSRAETALAVIREFSRNIPLTALVRCANRDAALVPQQITGGEDWFAVYRDYWKRCIDASFIQAVREHRREEALQAMRAFLDGGEPVPLSYAYGPETPDGLPIRGALGLSFLSAFQIYVFMPKLNPILEPVFSDGIFFRNENRIAYNNSYLSFMKLGDDIREFDTKLGPSGIFGAAYDPEKNRGSSAWLGRRKNQKVIHDASREAERVYGEAQEAARSMADLLLVILNHDGLSNPQTFAVKGKLAPFHAGLSEALTIFQRLCQILDEIQKIEDEENLKAGEYGI
ncbi:MAG: DUF5312 domain-containing protein [Treponema sp.]|nr:DUF5312 domain-containing protein [Treponema sp.]